MIAEASPDRRLGGVDCRCCLMGSRQAALLSLHSWAKGFRVARESLRCERWIQQQLLGENNPDKFKSKGIRGSLVQKPRD